MRISILLLTLALTSAHAAFGSDVQKIDEQTPEKKILTLLENTLSKLSQTKDVRIEIADSPTAAVFWINHHASDGAALMGPGNVTANALRVLVNELSIAEQRDSAMAAGIKADAKKRKHYFIRFRPIQE